MEGMAHEIARFPQACMRRACEGWVSNPGAAGSRFCQRRPHDIAILGKSDAQELNSWSFAVPHSNGPEGEMDGSTSRRAWSTPPAGGVIVPSAFELGGIDQELRGLNSQYCGRIGNGLIAELRTGSAWHPADMRAVG